MLPPSRETSLLSSSGKLKAKGIFPWNQGFTVCRSVEITSTGDELASASPVDVVSTDRHTVKPWFQGKIPFAFNLPELENSEFSLLGGRMTYLGQTPGAHLVYDARKHHISVFVFQERSLPARLSDRSLKPANLSFNMETWSQGGLRYFVIGDASAADIGSLAKLFKAAS